MYQNIQGTYSRLSAGDGRGGEGVSLFLLLSVNGANSRNSLNGYPIGSGESDGHRRKGNFAY